MEYSTGLAVRQAKEAYSSGDITRIKQSLLELVTCVTVLDGKSDAQKNELSRSAQLCDQLQKENESLKAKCDEYQETCSQLKHEGDCLFRVTNWLSNMNNQLKERLLLLQIQVYRSHSEKNNETLSLPLVLEDISDEGEQQFSTTTKEIVAILKKYAARPEAIKQYQFVFDGNEIVDIACDGESATETESGESAKPDSVTEGNSETETGSEADIQDGSKPGSEGDTSDGEIEPDSEGCTNDKNTDSSSEIGAKDDAGSENQLNDESETEVEPAPENSNASSQTRRGKKPGTKDRKHCSLIKELEKADKNNQIVYETKEIPISGNAADDCPICGSELVVVSKNRFVLEYQPAVLNIVKETVYKKECIFCKDDPDAEVKGNNKKTDASESTAGTDCCEAINSNHTIADVEEDSRISQGKEECSHVMDSPTAKDDNCSVVNCTIMGNDTDVAESSSEIYSAVSDASGETDHTAAGMPCEINSAVPDASGETDHTAAGMPCEINSAVPDVSGEANHAMVDYIPVETSGKINNTVADSTDAENRTTAYPSGEIDSSNEERRRKHKAYVEATQSEKYWETFKWSKEPVIPKSYASPSLLAFIFFEVYFMFTPLYRLEKKLLMMGYNVSRQVMSGWLSYISKTYVKPVYDLMLEHARTHDIVNIDETYFHSLFDKGGKAQTKGYIWTLYTASDTDPDHPFILMKFSKSRSVKVAEEILGEFKGYLGSDAYSAYINLSKDHSIVNVLCLAHARRKFVEALRIEAEGGKVPQSSRALYGVQFFDKIFELERKYKTDKLPSSKRYEMRLSDQEPLWNEFAEWLAKNDPVGKAANHLESAIAYSRKFILGLKGYLKDGRLEPTNMIVEHVHRKVAVYRKNALFAQNDETAQIFAMNLSLMVTAVASGLNPEAYMLWFLENAPDIDIRHHPERLLPAMAPQDCNLNKAYLEKYGTN